MPSAPLRGELMAWLDGPLAGASGECLHSAVEQVLPGALVLLP